MSAVLAAASRAYSRASERGSRATLAAVIALAAGPIPTTVTEWDVEKAKCSTQFAPMLWGVLLALLVALVWLSNQL